jgi:hypothetical protein
MALVVVALAALATLVGCGNEISDGELGAKSGTGA